MSLRATGGLILTMLVGLFLIDPAPARTLRTYVLDVYQSAFLYLGSADPASSAPVVIIDLDDASQRRFGQWPWPRKQLGALVTRLGQSGVKVVAFDILFPEADRLGSDQDSALAQAMTTLPVVLAQATATIATPDQAVSAQRAQLIGQGADWHRFVQSWPGYVGNIPDLDHAARGLGFISIAQESDGITRRLPLVFTTGTHSGVALCIETIRLFRDQQSIRIVTQADGISQIEIGDLIVPTDAQGRMWLSPARDHPTYISAADILDRKISSQVLDGKIALIGSSAEGLRDLKTIITGARIPGVEVHAQAITAILARQVASRPAFAPAIELLGLLAFGATLIYIAGRVGTIAMTIWTFAFAFGLAAIGFVFYVTNRWLIDGATIALCILIIAAGLNLAQWQQSEVRRRKLRHAFDHYLTPAMIERLVADPDALSLGGERREVTILFADIRGFTAMAEHHGHNPEELTRILNRAFTQMTDAVMAQNGTIDKMVGDSLIAFWNAPLDQPDHARRAILAAKDILAAMASMNDPPMQVGIGINTGICFVGNMGSAHRFNYTAMGDAVNVAARLESATRDHDVEILIGKSTISASGLDGFISMGELYLRGRQEPLEAFTLAH